jgi:hypothetical protein
MSTDEETTQDEEPRSENQDDAPQSEGKEKSAQQLAQEKEEESEQAEKEIKELEESDELPKDLSDWPSGAAKYETFGLGDDKYGDGVTEKLGPADLKRHEDGSVEVDGEKVDNPEDYKGEPITAAVDEVPPGSGDDDDSDGDSDSDSDSDSESKDES